MNGLIHTCGDVDEILTFSVVANEAARVTLSAGGAAAMVRLKLDDPSLTPKLVAFLRRCQCEILHLGPTSVGVGLGHPVDPDAAVQRVEDGRCYRCGEPIERVLFRLGSPRCHDCREGSGADPLSERDNAQETWTRMEVEAYLRVWESLHPGARVELVA